MTLGGPRSVQSNDRQTVQTVLGDLGNVLLREMALFGIMVGCLTTFTLTLVSIHGFRNDESLGKGFGFSRFYSATCRGIRSVDHWCYSRVCSSLTFFSTWYLNLCPLHSALCLTGCSQMWRSSRPAKCVITAVLQALHCILRKFCWPYIDVRYCCTKKIISEKISFFSLWVFSKSFKVKLIYLGSYFFFLSYVEMCGIKSSFSVSDPLSSS